MDDNCLVSDDGDKLDHGEEGSREDTEKVDEHADAVEILEVVETLSWSGRVRRPGARGAKGPLDVDGWESSKGETKEGTAKDEPQNGIVTLGETNGVVDLAYCLDEGVSRRTIGHGHGHNGEKPRREKKEEQEER